MHCILPTLLTKHKRDALIATVLFLAVCGFYFIQGDRLQNTVSRPYTYFDVFFELDAPRVIGDMLQADFNHERTSLHPLYVLFVNPLGSSLLKLPGAGNFSNALAILINAAFGSLSVAGLFILFRRMKTAALNAALISLIFALSMSQLVLSIVPETASLAVATHVLTYAFFWRSLYGNGLALRWWILAGVLAMGVTITNAAQPLLCYFVARCAAHPGNIRNAALKTTLLAACVLTLTVVLALLQKLLYPSSSLFFIPSWLHQETLYTNALALKEPLLTAEQLVKQFFVANIVGPLPHFLYLGQLLPVTTFSRSWSYSAAGYAALAGVIILAVCFNNREHYRRYRHWYLGLSLCVAFNVALHCVYGPPYKALMEFFLYSGNVTCALVLILFTKYLRSTRTPARLGLAGFLSLLALNNAGALQTMVNHYDNPEIAARAAQGWGSFDGTWKQLESTLGAYRAELTAAANLAPGTAAGLPWVERFFLFGLGERRKFIYRDGEVRDAKTGAIIARWHKAAAMIVPPAATVALRTTDGRFVYISEDQRGIFIDENGSRRTLDDKPATLPDYSRFRYPLLMQTLYREILTGFSGDKPTISIFVPDMAGDREEAVIRAALELRPGGVIGTQQEELLRSGKAAFSGWLYPLSWAPGRNPLPRAHASAQELNAAGIVAPHAPNAARLLFMLYQNGDIKPSQ